MPEKAPETTATPTIEQTTAVMREIIDAWHADRPASRISPKAEPLYGPALFAHVAHVHRLAEGVLTLYAADQTLTAMTLIRQMIETSMRAVWLTVYRENLYHLVRDGERQRKNAFEAAAKTGQIPHNAPGLVKALDWLDENERIKGATSGENFEELCKELEGGENIYAQYRLASNYTHPGSFLLEEYIDAEWADDGSLSRIAFVTKPDLSADAAWLALAAYMLILAGLSWDHVDRVHVHREMLRRHAQTYTVPTRRIDMTGHGFRNWNRAERARAEAARRRQ